MDYHLLEKRCIDERCSDDAKAMLKERGWEGKDAMEYGAKERTCKDRQCYVRKAKGVGEKETDNRT